MRLLCASLCVQVRMLFLESPFLSRDDSVSIMDGTDEGTKSLNSL